MPKCKPTLWSQDKLDRSIFRVLEGDDGEETDLSETSGTAVKKKTDITSLIISINMVAMYCIFQMTKLSMTSTSVYY